MKFLKWVFGIKDHPRFELKKEGWILFLMDSRGENAKAVGVYDTFFLAVADGVKSTESSATYAVVPRLFVVQELIKGVKLIQMTKKELMQRDTEILRFVELRLNIPFPKITL